MDHVTRRAVLRSGAGIGLAGIAGCLGGGGNGDGSGGDGSGGGSGGGGAGGNGSDGSGSGGGSGPTWRTAELTDVRNGETFTIQGLSKPVMLETFAVWCSTCLSQQKELRALHEKVGDSVTSVTLNIDPNEDEKKVKKHLDRHGFDWRYAVSPPKVTNSLVDQFGETMTVPPRAPVVLVCESGARRLGDGVKSASDLQSALDQGC